MFGLRVVKSVNRKTAKEIIHDANDVCKSAEIPSVLGGLDDYETAYIDHREDTNFEVEKWKKSLNRVSGEYFHD